jgi:hypothetical protein
MKFARLFAALALGAVVVPALALADDPKDPLLSRSAEARARDKAIIRKLNQDQLAHVRERDAQYAEGWTAYREQNGHNQAYASARADYNRAMDDYARERAQYERERSAWRRAVQLCEAGHYEYCER